MSRLDLILEANMESLYTIPLYSYPTESIGRISSKGMALVSPSDSPSLISWVVKLFPYYKELQNM